MGFDIGKCKEDGAGDEKLIADKRIECTKRRGKIGVTRAKGTRKAASKATGNGCLWTTTDSLEI
jgi:hypothetical protein